MRKWRRQFFIHCQGRLLSVRAQLPIHPLVVAVEPMVFIIGSKMERDLAVEAPLCFELKVLVAVASLVNDDLEGILACAALAKCELRIDGVLKQILELVGIDFGHIEANCLQDLGIPRLKWANSLVWHSLRTLSSPARRGLLAKTQIKCNAAISPNRYHPPTQSLIFSAF